MIAGGNHTTIHAGTALAVTERALSAPCGGTSPKGRGKYSCLIYSNLSQSYLHPGPLGRDVFNYFKIFPWKNLYFSEKLCYTDKLGCYEVYYGL